MARTSLLGLAIGLGVLLMGGVAAAQCCAPPPPSCCTPPPPPPPQSPPCCTPGHNVNVPGVNVFVAGAVNVNVNAQARASAVAGAGSTVFVGGGGGTSFYAPPVATGVIQGLRVGGGVKRIAYQATRSKSVKVVIQAVCIDDRYVAHPASQVRPDREVDELYDGELYRCLAGSRLQWTRAEYLGKVDFSKGETTMCGKGEALYHSKGALDCRRQKPARDCNERSLLRRFGAGIKILTMTIVETYTAYREEQAESVVSSMSLDGGVGGVAY